MQRSGPHLEDDPLPISLLIFECTVLINEASNEYVLLDRVRQGLCTLSASDPVKPVFVWAGAVFAWAVAVIGVM
jgi:hypothetical protein